MKFINLKFLFFLYFFLSVISIGYGNTSRDLGPAPKLNGEIINKWILFYTNIERVKRNLLPLRYDKKLSQAARWQARYCKKKKVISNLSNIKGMKNPNERIGKFAGRNRNVGENVTVEFASNVSNKRYYFNADSNGQFKDYGDFEVYWYDERELGHVMVKSLMNNPVHRKNILKKKFTSMGTGVAKGVYSQEKSHYGCQVFSDKKDREFKKLEIKGPIGEKRKYKIKYSGKYKVKIISLDRSKGLIKHKIVKKENKYYYKKKNNKEYYICLFDKKNNILYPVKVIR